MVTDIFNAMSMGSAPESAAQANEWLDGHNRTFGMYIGGVWVHNEGAGRFDSINPSTGAVLASLTQASIADVDNAVAAARAAFPAWAGLSGHTRARYLYAIARQIQKHARLFAVLETLDNG